MKNNVILTGTELKLNINIEPMGELRMADYDFSIDVWCSNKRVITVQKEQAVYVDKDNYIVMIDTGLLGAGVVKCKVTAYLPDADFGDVARTEVIGIVTDIEVANNL